MIVYAVYIISSDGLPILTVDFQLSKNPSDDLLLGGFLTAVQDLIKNIINHKSELRIIEIDNFTIHIHSFGLYQIALVTSLAKPVAQIIQKIGLRFMQDYGEKIPTSIINTKEYEPFASVIAEIVQEDISFGSSQIIRPTKNFSSSELFKLPSDLLPVALAMISLKSGTLDDIAQNQNEKGSKLLEKLKLLQKLGFIGKKNTEGSTIYFCTL